MAPDCAPTGKAENSVQSKEIAVQPVISEICKRLDIRGFNEPETIGQAKHGQETHLLYGVPTHATCQRIQNQSMPSIGCAPGRGNLSEGHRTTGVICVSN